MPAPSVSIKVTVLENSKKQNYKSYTLSNTPFYFYPDWIENSSEYSQNNIIWDFGDGTTFVGPSASYFYKFPGHYEVSATFFDKQGSAYTITCSTKLTAFNAMPDTLVFDKFTPSQLEGIYLLPAGKKSEPLKIYRYNSWQSDKQLSKNNYTINLYASGCNSAYFSPEDYYKGRYSHLRNFFGFIETVISNDISSTTVVDNTTTTSVSVFAEPLFDDLGNITFNFSSQPLPNSVFAGTTGSAISENKFVSFIDQTPTGDGKTTLIYLYSHFNGVGLEDLFTKTRDLYTYLTPLPYSVNNTTWQSQYLKSVFNPANSISITSNGITVEGDYDVVGSLSGQQVNLFNIYPIKWTDSNISFCCTFKDNALFTTKNYPSIKKFRFDGKAPDELNTISFSLLEYPEPEYRTDLLNIKEAKPVYNRIDNAVFEKNQSVPDFTYSGYFCGTVKTATPVAVAAISACALIQDEPIYNLGITYGYAGQPGIGNIKRFNKKIMMDHCNRENLEFKILTNEVNNIPTSQDSSIGISVLPMENYKLGQNRVYVAAADQDAIKIYTPNGNSIGTIDLKNALIYTGENNLPIAANLLGDLEKATPASIALDSKGNAWVSLFDAISCFKFDYSTLTITACAVPPFKNKLYDSSEYVAASGFAGENSLIPACIDTDINDNILIGYSHPLSGLIVKYDKSGQYINHVSIPLNMSVQEIIVDITNNIYAIVKSLDRNNSNPHFVTDYIFKWDGDFNLKENFPVPINNIGSASIDLNQNIYVVNGPSGFTRISPDGTKKYIPLPVEPATFMQYIGGIACDEEGFLWILHNQMGQLYFYPVSNLEQLPLSGIYRGPLPDIQIITPTGNQAHYSVAGDWTGIRWINKYVRKVIPAPRYISGESNLFTILGNKPVISKINENYDQETTFKSYVLQESLLNKPQLFDNFLGQIVGNSESLPTDLGKTIFEKIANFTSNNSDIDTCEINSLESAYAQCGKPFNKFSINYPPKLRRVMNILSIKQSKLFGSPNTYNKNFNTQIVNKSQNLGSEISIENGFFVAGEPIVAYEKFSETFRIIYNTIIIDSNFLPVSAGTVCPLSGINHNWGWGLVTSSENDKGPEIGQFYRFYKYIPYMPLTPVDSVIDFNNEQNTFTNSQSSYVEWTKYGGTMHKALSRALYEGLELYD